MGYRHYFYEIDNNDVLKIQQCQTNADYCDFVKSKGKKINDYGNGDYFAPYDVGESEVFEFGKLYYNNLATQIQSTGAPLFLSAELQERYEDYDAYVVHKEGVLKAIDFYHQQVVNSLEYIFKTPEQILEDIKENPRHLYKEDKLSIEEKCKQDCDERLFWIRQGIVDLDEDYEENHGCNKWRVSSSWLYEHSIFNLVHILKTFDWANKSLIFLGW